jgi:hypothetical protein
VHEREVETVLGAVHELLHRVRVVAPPLLPCRLTETDVRREVRERGDGERRRGIGRRCWRQEGVHAVVEVREQEDLAVGEGLEERGLIDAIERARFDLANAVFFE